MSTQNTPINISQLSDVEICLLEQLTYLDEDVARAAFGSINYENLGFYKISRLSRLNNFRYIGRIQRNSTIKSKEAS